MKRTNHCLRTAGVHEPAFRGWCGGEDIHVLKASCTYIQTCHSSAVIGGGEKGLQG